MSKISFELPAAEPWHGWIALGPRPAAADQPHGWTLLGCACCFGGGVGLVHAPRHIRQQQGRWKSRRGRAALRVPHGSCRRRRGSAAAELAVGTLATGATRADPNAYRVCVSSTRAGLSADQGDLWDSRRVTTGQSLHIEYAGKPLRSAQDCFWKVRVWDQDGQESDWSEPALDDGPAGAEGLAGEVDRSGRPAGWRRGGWRRGEGREYASGRLSPQDVHPGQADPAGAAVCVGFRSL